jgi:hypothetical protein
LTDGTVTGGSFATESFPVVAAVLEAALDVTGVDEAATVFSDAAPAPTTVPAGGISSTPGDGRVSFPAAQASDVTRTKETIMVNEKYLFD